MYNAVTKAIEHDRIFKYSLNCDGFPIAYSQVLSLWETDSDFRNFFSSLLRDSPFAAFRWETPSITSQTLDRGFEFVLINSPGFSSRRTDAIAYQDYFTSDDASAGIVAFQNLGGDATLVVPSPRTKPDAYGHLAAFIRNAPETQIDELWRVIAKTVKLQLGDSPRWLSTAGGGVAWLHVRIDSSPKYYGYTPYRKPE